MKEENAYILGTDQEELHRLGVQHQVWASEAQQGWINAGFTRGHHLLDLGSGPGFCTKELAFICGKEGSVTAIDRSAHFTEFLKKIKDQYGLPINPICSILILWNWLPISMMGCIADGHWHGYQILKRSCLRSIIP